MSTLTKSATEVLVTTDWVQQHLNDQKVRIVEVDVDTTAYDEGHLPGTVGWNWQTQLCDTIRRDVISKQELEKLLGRSGIDNQTTIILYGDNNNWFAAWAFWQLKIYRHEDVRLMDGGRGKWVAEERILTKESSDWPQKSYKAKEPNWEIRAFLPQVQEGVQKKNIELVDVRSPDEYTGKILAPAGLPETCQRGGHIPGAKSIPWSKAVNEDGSFNSSEEIYKLYRENGITFTKPIVAYCRIGERSSHAWFVLKYLVGHEKVKNYDGSWTEWGNLVGAEVEK